VPRPMTGSGLPLEGMVRVSMVVAAFASLENPTFESPVALAATAAAAPRKNAARVMSRAFASVPALRAAIITPKPRATITNVNISNLVPHVQQAEYAPVAKGGDEFQVFKIFVAQFQCVAACLRRDFRGRLP
jgi:hypothetical protein